MTITKKELIEDLKKQITDGFEKFGAKGTFDKIEGMKHTPNGWKYNNKPFSKITKNEAIEILNKITF